MEYVFSSGNFIASLTETPLSITYAGSFFRPSEDDVNDPSLSNRALLDFFSHYEPQDLFIDMSKVDGDSWGLNRLWETVIFLRNKGFNVLVRQSELSAEKLAVETRYSCTASGGIGSKGPLSR